MEDLIIYYNEKPVSALNKALVEKQKLDDERIKVLKSLHVQLLDIHEIMKNTNDRQELKECAQSVEQLEFMMQEAWGFEKNSAYHTHWYKVPKCTCPRMDNMDLMGVNRRNIDGKCLVHGNL